MCRMLGIVASEPTDFKVCLREAPRSLATLSRDHPHGWGLAVLANQDGWKVEKHPACAGEDARFHDVASSRGDVLVAHIRKRTVGAIRQENTHPFQRGRWVFAHNGTIDELAWMRRDLSPLRAADIVGDTDSEVFFACVLSRFDDAGLGDGSSPSAIGAVLARFVEELATRPKVGACNFLLANDDGVYAYRQGRTLFALERGPTDAVRVRRESQETGATIETPWTARRTAVLVASERMTDEPWREVHERTLLHVSRRPAPSLTVLRGAVAQ
jgi:predicted glutamine amidotransferase